MLKTAGLFLFAAIATYAIHALGQLRADTRAMATAVGNSSSNGTSFAWFYDSAERTVFVCRIGQAPTDPLDCKAKATLP
jgi:hypothetical protein